MVRRLFGVLLAALLATFLGSAAAAEPAGEFVRGVNLNGPAVEIAGRAWEAGDTPHIRTRDRAFENQAVPLVPEAGPELARMIRSSRWSNAVELTLLELPAGEYWVYLYVWEDNNSERFTVRLGEGPELEIESGSAGSWRRLGPMRGAVAEKTGTLKITTRGGAANLSGLEIWRGGPASQTPSAESPVEGTVSAEQAAHFREKIAPLLAKHCLECHGGSQKEGGLVLDTWRGFSRGGKSGKAVEPGDPSAGLLWEYVEADEMPQDRPPLSEEEKQLLHAWLADGAAWGVAQIDPFEYSSERRAGYDWWSLQPLAKSPLPAVRQTAWPRNEIDFFVLAKLEAEGLVPAPEADRRTLIRRLTFDLTGLPPSPEEVEQFATDKDPQAYEKLVDRLLESPHYGERWARHWLDVVRFGESQGFERNRVRESAWRYRDWVIEALNADVPYDEFIRLQLAGDVLHPGDFNALTATGYHVCGTWDQVGHLEGSASMKVSARHDHLEDLVATFGQAFLGLTINCARCHDHKFDPIRQREYYAFAGLLAGVNQEEKEREEPGDPPRKIHAIIPRQPPEMRVLARGDAGKPGEVAPLTALAAIRSLPADLGLATTAPEAERRRKLAEWITDARNPLPPRVMANRVWHYHFGVGIVDTPGDFGYSGGRPSHPELLDFLAARLVEGGWRLKGLHRLIVTSAAYRQSSRVKNEAAAALDAENRLLWRAHARRLEGEAVRDSMLAVAGALNPQLGGPSFRDVNVKLERNHEFTTPTNEFTEETRRRSIYRLWARSGNHPLLSSLDCPDPTVMTPSRTRTITPLQALSLLNNGFVEKCAERFAARLTDAKPEDREGQISLAYELAFAREPSDRELKLSLAFAEERGLASFCLVLFNTNEFLFVN